MTEGKGQPNQFRSGEFDAYLDGLLTGADREAFEKALADRPELRAEIEQQRALDRSLETIFTAPDAEVIIAHLRSKSTGPAKKATSSPLMGLSRYAAIAAAVAILLFAGWRIMDTMKPEPVAEKDNSVIPDWNPRISPVEAYERAMTVDFKPSWICKDDREFAETFGKLFGQPILLAQTPEGVNALGLGYANTMTESTLILSCKVHGEGVLVCIDRLNYDPKLTISDESHLRLFRRELGKVVLYEITPLDKPHVLELFYATELPLK